LLIKGTADKMNHMDRTDRLIQKIPVSSLSSRLPIIIIVIALVLGTGTGYVMSTRGSKSVGLASPGGLTQSKPTAASQDNQTFRDFAEGTLQKKPAPTAEDDYSEGTHLLTRPNAQPVALTSSVVDLDQFVGKKVKVYGETQKALKEGWLMDVGKVEVE
jgi:hypothetical protein